MLFLSPCFWNMNIAHEYAEKWHFILINFRPLHTCCFLCHFFRPQSLHFSISTNYGRQHILHLVNIPYCKSATVAHTKNTFLYNATLLLYTESKVKNFDIDSLRAGDQLCPFEWRRLLTYYSMYLYNCRSKQPIISLHLDHRDFGLFRREKRGLCNMTVLYLLTVYE